MHEEVEEEEDPYNLARFLESMHARFAPSRRLRDRYPPGPFLSLHPLCPPSLSTLSLHPLSPVAFGN